MARMSIDDSIARDPRITLLALLLGWSRRETVGCLVAEVWPITYDQKTHLVHPRMVNAAAGREDFAEKMIEAELATRDRGGRLVIKGAKERIKYLDHKSDAGRQGGLKSAEVRAQKSKQTSSSGGSRGQAAGNPPVPDPVPASVPPPAPDPVLDQRRDQTAALPPVLALVQPPKPRKRPEPTYTEQETATVKLVLGKLTDRTGIAYQGSKHHTALIASRLRAGFTAWDLRRVIAYCADELGWQDDPRMKAYLRPETLFGPEAMEKYIYAARAWMPEAEPTDNDDRAMTGARWAEPEWMRTNTTAG